MVFKGAFIGARGTHWLEKSIRYVQDGQYLLTDSVAIGRKRFEGSYG